MERHVIALVGAYGSGKTELSLNIAKELSKTGVRTVLSDIDIVNPYFRSSEKVKWLADMGVEVITPVFANTTVDSPMLSPKVGGYFIYDDINYILDAGGDSVGATALGQYRHKFRENDGKLLYVVNTNRPFTNSVNSILDMISGIEKSSSMEIDGVILNSNMSFESTKEDLISGYEIVKDVCKALNKPLVLVCGMKDQLQGFVEDTGYKGQTFIIERQMGLDY